MFDLSLSLPREGRELQAHLNADDSLKNIQKVDRTIPIQRKRPRIIRTKRPRIIRGPIIIHSFSEPHPLLKFVTKETVAFLFNIKVAQIYRIECWQHVVYVHAEGISRFVSYADFPPVIEAEEPDSTDLVYWRKRWDKKWKIEQAPEFWVGFYANKFKGARSIEQQREWGELIAVFKFCFDEVDLERLREDYAYQRWLKLNSIAIVS